MKNILIILFLLVSVIVSGQSIGGEKWRQIMYIQYYYQQKYIEYCETDSVLIYSYSEVIPTGNPMIVKLRTTEVYDKDITPSFEGYHEWLGRTLGKEIELDIAK